jgi:hypothetical protein
MEPYKLIDREDDWSVLVTLFPEGWQAKAHELGAIQRRRKFLNAETLLRTLLIHLADGCSLRETVVRAKYGELVSISDVALLKRLKASGEWLRWMAESLMRHWVEKQPASILGTDLRVRLIDASTIQEPGSTGSTWRLHYSIRLPSLQCDDLLVTDTEVGETFKHFQVQPKDLLIGDRGLAHRPGIAHVVQGGGQVLVRTNLTHLPFMDPNRLPFPLLPHLRKLKKTQFGDWDVVVIHGENLISGRICALKKSKEAAERAKQRARKESAKKGHAIQPETLEAAEYIFVFTTLDRTYPPEFILELYRGRWQIELVFKRLKSIIGLGHLKKTDIDGAKAWIHGKLLVAFLIEALIAAGERFFPWGYAIGKNQPAPAMPLEGKLPHVALVK